MKGNGQVIAIYGSRGFFRNQRQALGYFIFYLVDVDGPIEQETLGLFWKQWQKEVMIAEDSVQSLCSDGSVGAFESLDQLKQFLAFLCQELKFQRVNLLSQDHFNSLIENTGHREELWHSLSRAGDELHFDQVKKGNIWERIFT